jgi:hypothetical protein
LSISCLFSAGTLRLVDTFRLTVEPDTGS